MFEIMDLLFQSTSFASSAWLLSLRRSGITTVQGNRRMGFFFFTFTRLRDILRELQAYNMIPFHGIRSGFGTRLAFFSFFFFLAALPVATPKTCT